MDYNVFNYNVICSESRGQVEKKIGLVDICTGNRIKSQSQQDKINVYE